MDEEFVYRVHLVMLCCCHLLRRKQECRSDSGSGFDYFQHRDVQTGKYLRTGSIIKSAHLDLGDDWGGHTAELAIALLVEFAYRHGGRFARTKGSRVANFAGYNFISRAGSIRGPETLSRSFGKINMLDLVEAHPIR